MAKPTTKPWFDAVKTWLGRARPRVRGGHPVGDDRTVIALIDDDISLTAPLACALEEAGYTVLTGTNGPQGIAILEKPVVDLAIVDIVLTGHIDGLTVVREARRHHPTLRVILTSGKPPPPGFERVAPFLPKPFRVNELLAIVERALTTPVDQWSDRPTSA